MCTLLLLWGKTNRDDPRRYHPLLCHMLDVAAVCHALLQVHGPVADLANEWSVYLAALHDVGKADPLFQNKNPEQAARLRKAGVDLPQTVVPFRHEARSADWVRGHLLNDHGWNTSAAVAVAQALAAHHGNFQPTLEEAGGKTSAVFQGFRSDIARWLAGTLSHVPRAPSLANASRTGAQLAGLVVFADWVASHNGLYCPPAVSSATDDYLDAARKEAARALARLRLAPARRLAPPQRFADLWPAISSLRPAQRTIEGLCREGLGPGLAIIEAPTGDGKTEAAIYLAEHWQRISGRNGLYLALPTAATSNQMHARYASFLDRRQPGTAPPYLVHGMAWLVDEVAPRQSANTEDGDLARDWFRNRRRALLAPHAVGTVDQAMLAALHVRFGFLRLFGLAGKVLVVDEVHAYDEYMTTILERLLQWCHALQVPVILLSATLSSRQKSRLLAAYGATPSAPVSAQCYPLVTHVDMAGAVSRFPVADPRTRQVALRRHPGLLQDAAAIADLAVSLVNRGGCACVLVNTVTAAQEIYRALKRRRPAGLSLHLFHGRFRAERRQEIEGQVAALFGKEAGPARPQRAILVATQVVEQSLDLDFDVMASAVAPVDLLLQRAGRLHRHERGTRPTGSEAVLHLLLPAEGTFSFGPSERIYHRLPLLRTLGLLAGIDRFSLPHDFRVLVEACYGDSPVPGVPDDLLAHADTQRRSCLEEYRTRARQHLLPEPTPDVFALAWAPYRPVEEAEDGDRANYLHAQTRLGDERRRVLVLHNPADLAIARSATPPSREDIKRLFMQMADLPSRWLDRVEPDNPTDEICPAPDWLRGLHIVPMQGGTWRGRDSSGRQVALVDDPELGLCRIAADKENVDADV